MVKGVSIKFKSYPETVKKLLDLIKFESEIKKHNKIILKPYISLEEGKSTPVAFVNEVLKACLAGKKPEAEIFIAEGVDGDDTMDAFEREGYKKLSEQYSIGLIDLNSCETEEILDGNFLKFEYVRYPKILLESFVISLPKFCESSELEMEGALSIMVGAFPSSHYSGFFSRKKNKIAKWPMKYSIHDILRCKMPEFAIMDASDKGAIFAGVPLEIDKQAAKLLGKESHSVGYLKLVEESFSEERKKKDVSNIEESVAKEE